MIFGLIEHEKGELAEGSLQMLAFAKETAAGAGMPLTAVLMGELARPLAEEVGKYGVSSVILVTGEGLSDYAPEAWASALISVIDQKQPAMVTAAATDRGNEVMALAAAKTNRPLAAACSEVRPGDPFEITRLRWGSSLLEDAVLEGDVKLFTVAMHVVATPEPGAAEAVEVETVSPELSEADFRVRLVGREEIVTEGVTLKNAPVVIGGGRGVGSAEGYAVLEELAGLLGGAVGGSRVATNNGWRPHSDQIGLTGSRISPDLYIACGVSGAIQHLVGCKGAKRILVINNDPEAAFFAKADYGVLGDLHEVIPALIEEIKKQ